MEAGPTVTVVSTGDELLLGDVVDTNGAEISRMLAAVGLRTVLRITVGDDESSLKSVIQDAVGRAEVVVITGGLGPTDDDLTRFVVSDLSAARHERGSRESHQERSESCWSIRR